MNTGSNLTSGRLLARNTLLNIGGEAAPFIVAFVAIPVLIHSIGADAYGVLMLVVLVAGYLGVFSFGLGAAATKFISEAAASGDRADIPGLFWSSLFLMGGFGICSAAVLAALSPWLVTQVLKIAPALRSESLYALYLMALSLPFVTSGGTFGAALSAFQRFDLINALRVPTGVLYYVAPLMVLAFSHSLVWIVTSVIVVRLVSWTTNLALCLYILPELRDIAPRRTMVRPLLTFGGWMMLSVLVGSLVEYGDRFLIGSMVSVAAVAYYTVPYQVTNKLRVVPGAISGVIFPAFSGGFHTDRWRTAVLFERATRYTLLALFPPVLFIITLAPDALALWVDPSFAGHSAFAMRWLAIGVFFNGLAWIPSALINAENRPDLPAKLHAVVAPAYLLLLWWVLPKYGVAGAAAAYAFRTAIEMVFLFALARRLMPDLTPGVVRFVKIALLVLPILVIGMLPMSLSTKGIFLVAVLSLYTLACWTILLESEDKDFLRGYIRGARIILAGASE